MANILLVDDDIEILNVLTKSLEREQHTVVCADNGNTAMKKLQDFQPDLIITDLIMPEKEGLELIQEIRRLKTNIKMIAMSGGNRIDAENFLHMAKLLGADITLEKPFSRASLMEAVECLI